jgi:hypothetical protein
MWFMAETENGAASLATSESARLDLFFKITRDIKTDVLEPLLRASWAEDATDTMKIIFNSRDCRGGKGDRAPFFTAMTLVSREYPERFAMNIDYVPEYGRWSDMVQLYSLITDESHKHMIIDIVATQLNADLLNMTEGQSVSLLAKWLPTESKKMDRCCGEFVSAMCDRLGIRSGRSNYAMMMYRKKWISPLREYLRVTERLMCGNHWNEIDFNKVPSVCMKNMRSAFLRHTPSAFTEWVERLKSGNNEAKVNASQLYPHDIVRAYCNTTHKKDDVLEEQWKCIVEAARQLGTFKRSLVISDVSGSMQGVPMEVSIALGVLISGLSEGPFRDRIITFTSTPEFHDISTYTSLFDKVRSIQRMHWCMTTDLQKVFDLILCDAERANLCSAEMPERLYILSDMQFDQATHGSSTNFEAIDARYAKLGYKRPDIVFWNLRSNTSDMPVRHNEQGVALLSGYSPSIMKGIMSETLFSPWSVMRNVIDADRYAKIR